MSNRSDAAPLAEVLRLVGDALRDLRYGQIVIQVHGGNVVQIERTEKMRPTPPPAVAANGSDS